MKDYELKYSNQSNQVQKSCGCESISGNSVDIKLFKDDCEVRADVVVSKRNGVRVWGQVKGCDGTGVSDVLVKLLKVVYICGKEELQGVAHTMTDCNGFYQFEIDGCDCSNKYKIIVNKSATGGERVIKSTGCNPCESNKPCPPKPIPCDDDEIQTDYCK